MVKHIVLFKLKTAADGKSREENLPDLRARLEALPGRIPGILKFEVGININPSSHAFDLALYSEFPDELALVEYQRHPAHQEVVTFVNQVCERRHVVDWEG